jgi:hypothetical protein
MVKVFPSVICDQLKFVCIKVFWQVSILNALTFVALVQNF